MCARRDLQFLWEKHFHKIVKISLAQINLFSTCGDENILNGRHHVETYPATPLRRSVKRNMEVIDDPAEDASSIRDYAPSGVNRANEWREDFDREERQTSGLSAEKSKLKLDRPFLYFVRHNPSGIILHMGRFNPRLLSWTNTHIHTRTRVSQLKCH